MVLKLRSNEKCIEAVWEWCKNVWYSNPVSSLHRYQFVWEWCKNVWYSNWISANVFLALFENDVKMYGTQTEKFSEWQVIPFENDVKMYGTQTELSSFSLHVTFENDVKMYGTQTSFFKCLCLCVFENDVKMYGTQTRRGNGVQHLSLRMM